MWVRGECIYNVCMYKRRRESEIQSSETLKVVNQNGENRTCKYFSSHTVKASDCAVKQGFVYKDFVESNYFKRKNETNCEP